MDNVRGVRLPFTEVPSQVKEPREYRMAESQIELINRELELMQNKGAIAISEEEEGQFISNIFSRPKPNNRLRIILDLTELNEYLQYEKFKMTNLKTAYDLILPNAFMGSIDLRDAYYSLPIHPQHRKYLKFRWQGKLFQFDAMPNGLACAPRVFTKIMLPVFAFVREQKGNCFHYIDDSFVIDEKYDTCQEILKFLAQTLDDLGFVIHDEKSVTQPTQKLTFLGFIIDTVQMRVTPTSKKVEKIKTTGEALLRKEWMTIREVASFVGLAQSYAEASDYGRNHLKEIEIEGIKALACNQGRFEAKMWLRRPAKQNILWWIQNIANVSKDLSGKKPELCMETDASLKGWGAILEGKKANGRWAQQHVGLHINVLELTAVLLGLRSLCKDRDRVIKVLTDNATTVAYINKQGGVRSAECQKVAKEIWDWAEQNNYFIIAAHIPGANNTLADFYSRNFKDNTEWQLSDALFHTCCKQWGTPNIDMFAAFNNKKLKRYAAWKPDPHAEIIDCFSVNWSGLCVYCFPPFSLVGRVLKKMVTDGASGIVICPNWPGQPWYGQLSRLPKQRLKFPKRQGNLLHHNPKLLQDQLASISLIACLF